MASTRNKNTPGEYKQEQNRNNAVFEYYRFENGPSGKATLNGEHVHFDLGSNPSSRPAGELSKNFVDIESSLRGIGANNNVSRQPDVLPQLKDMKFVSYFDRPKVQMPDPLVIEDNQRPKLH